MAICSINMTVENRRDFAAMAMFLHMLLAGAGAMLVYCYFVMRSLLQELNGLLYEHYKSIYVESAIVIGLVMILVHGYGVKVLRPVHVAGKSPHNSTCIQRRIQEVRWVRTKPPPLPPRLPSLYKTALC